METPGAEAERWPVGRASRLAGRRSGLNLWSISSYGLFLGQIFPFFFGPIRAAAPTSAPRPGPCRPLQLNDERDKPGTKSFFGCLHESDTGNAPTITSCNRPSAVGVGHETPPATQGVIKGHLDSTHPPLLVRRRQHMSWSSTPPANDNTVRRHHGCSRHKAPPQRRRRMQGSPRKKRPPQRC